MRVDQEYIRKLLNLRDFETLFNYLGWDDPENLQSFPGPEAGSLASPVAVKRGIGVWRISGVTTAANRHRIDRDIQKQTRERLLIFEEENQQRWLWPEMRPSGSGYRMVEHIYTDESHNEALIQRLTGIAFTLEEENDLTVIDALTRVRKQFNVDEVTKQFYKQFKEHHEKLAEFIKGIRNDRDQRLYGSVLLNRLMFIYFLQKKRFLNNDPDYLRNCLTKVRRLLGKNSFYGFYRKFLLPLFHEGFGSHQHLYNDPKIAEIIGEVPYVNGAIFDIHYLEEKYHIDIPDHEFIRIFDFFDQYRWHLDERPTYKPNEINPDVLGYVFEQLINQKEQGAYYTREDITDYMTSVTVIPVLLDRLDVADNPMDLLPLEPERYIYESISYGITEELPDNIAVGVADPALIVDEEWFEKSPRHIGLPGETWWETIDRHRRYRELRKQITEGEIHTMDDAITANLDLRRLVIDFLGMLTPIESVESAYRTLQKITILDPTCGSGAFLFAALDILADCYKTLLDRAEELSIEDIKPNILREADEHHNHMYFIYKQAMLNNLYGVDLNAEASEIARLRMFLKLAAQITDPQYIEPLPDLDLNIKTGNLLVGIAHLKDAKERLGADLFGYHKWKEIEKRVAPLASLMIRFSILQQQDDDPDILLEMKGKIKIEQKNLRTLLNEYLYLIRAEQDDFDQWVDTHQPFHWFTEFPTILTNDDGFDVITGNPPYISNRQKKEYRLHGFQTQNLPNIYAPCIERSLQLLKPRSCFSMILPISFQCGEKFAPLRKMTTKYLSNIWISSYSKLPDSLFPDTKLNGHAIFFGNNKDDSMKLLSTRFLRWTKNYRPFLFENITYNLVTNLNGYKHYYKLGSHQEMEIINRLLSYDYNIERLTNKGDNYLYYKRAVWNYLSFFIDIPPAYNLDRSPTEQTNIGCLQFSDVRNRNIAFVISLSKLSLLWWVSTGNGFTLAKGELYSIPIPNNNTLLNKLENLLSIITPPLKETLGYRKNKGKWNGNYDVRKIRHLTDKVDRLILREIGLEDHWHALQLFYAFFTKQSREQSVLLKQPKFDCLPPTDQIP